MAITNGVKIQKSKEGVHERKATKYPMVDQVTDVSVMIGVYASLAVLEICQNDYNVLICQHGQAVIIYP